MQKRYLPIYQDNNVAPPYNGNPSARSSNLQYYSDDTAYIETDPRGATATFTYNNRKLVGGISYYSPSGVAAKPNVSFSYDQLGIRSFMSDGAGTVTYNINTLGRIISETRQFTMSGAPTSPYTVNYDYGLAGQLKSVTDPFGDQINYSHDKSGRLTAVTGATPFAGVTNYLSGVQYRAWGAVKNNRTYDIRMRLTSTYQSGTINYQYNKANDLTYAEMATGSPYHQTYGYDHIGRLTSVSTPEITVPSQYVLTQSNPPNGLPPNYKVRPFTTNVTYDEFDNATSSGGNYWHDITWNLNATPQSFTTTYVNGRAKKDGVAGKVYNNRDEVWSYNAMGQVANDTRTVQTFDSAGQTTRTEDVANAQIYVNYAYDGDGRQVKFDQKRDDGTTELRFRIYSTVLGGLLSDVKASGQKIETRVYTFVYPESAVRQVKAYSVPNYGSYPDTVVFEGSDPHGTRAQVWDRDTNTSKTLALAAPGAYVEDINWQGMKDRYVSGIGSQIAYGQQAASQYLGSYFSNIDPRNPGTGCSLDGVKERCDKVIRAANQGALKSIAFSTTGGSGGVGGDTGILAGAFSNAQGSLKGNRDQACKNNCAIGPDGEPITPATVYPTNFFLGFGAGFGLTGEQQGPKPSPGPTPLQKPVCYITLVARKIRELNIESGPFKGVGVNAYHLYVLTKQSGGNSQLDHHGFPSNKGRLTAETLPFDSNDWDYNDTNAMGSLGSVQAVVDVAGSCDPIRKNFSATQKAIIAKNILYTMSKDNSNAVAYTFLAQLDKSVLASLERKLFTKLAFHSIFAPNNVPHTPPIIPGWGNNLLSPKK